MKKFLAGLVLAAALSTPALAGSMGTSAAALEIGTADSVPAATLLLPFFEVDLGNPNGITTLFSINNASATATVAHVTMWTDQGIPTANFDVYLTGYDVQTINVRDIFLGNLPRTADDGSDPTDTISKQGPLSQDINFPGASGPCATPYVNPALDAATRAHLAAAHTGQASAVFGGMCSGANLGGNIARGYITVDTVSQCNLMFPSDATYFSGGIATNQNVLWGDYFFVSPAQNFAQGDMLVHVEACVGASYLGFVGNGAGNCPFAAGTYTFYGRYAAVAGMDQREPLATTFASRFLNGGAFSGGTDFLVWRDTKTTPTAANGPYACGGNPAWFPLTQADLVVFDEAENPTDICTGTNCMPLAASRIDASTFPTAFGWLYANLNHNVVNASLPTGVAQAWVVPVMDAEGRFSVGFRAMALDTALTSTGGAILIP